MNIPLSPCVPENLVSRDGFSPPVPRQPAHLHAQAESGAYLRGSSRVPRRRPFMKPPYAIGSVPSLSGHAIAYRWLSLPRVRRHWASKPQGSSERVLPWQVTMGQLIFAFLSHRSCRVPELSIIPFATRPDGKQKKTNHSRSNGLVCGLEYYTTIVSVVPGGSRGSMQLPSRLARL